MSLTCGFYNSLNGDRKYNAVQMASIFDGIIKDGVFATIGSAMAVTADSGLTVKVGTGRAWFDHTWTLNDTILPITAEASEILLDRIDAVVLEINAEEGIRANSIKIVKGTPASSPVNPEMINNDLVHQYPLCYIYRKATSTEITQVDITNAVGTAECPFVTGVLKVVAIDDFISQWRAEFDQWKTNEETEYNEWFSTFKAALEENAETFQKWMDDEQTEFDTWFESIRNKLSGDIAANLANQISEHVSNKNNPHGVTPEGIGAARESHGTHVAFSEVKPSMSGSGTAGTAATVARSDHQHPTDISRAPAYTYGDTDLVAGESPLATGTLYFVYE